MSTKYNLLPNASHFIAYFCGGGTQIHYSYTPTHLYCKTKMVIADTEFEYVEFCEIDEDALSDLNAMSADDYTGPGSYFNNWHGSEHAPQSLEKALYGYRLALAGCEELEQELEHQEPGSDAYHEIESSLSAQHGTVSDELSAIETILESLNRKSGFCNKSRILI